MRAILPGSLYTFHGMGVGRVYFIKSDTGQHTLVDTAMPFSGKRILKTLREHGYAPTDIKRIIITHAHPDHVGSLPFLVAETHAEVVCSHIEKPYLEGTEKVPRADKDQLKGFHRVMYVKPEAGTGVPSTTTVDEGNTIDDLLGGAQIVLTPGHSPGHMALWFPESRTVISGDVVMNYGGFMLPPPAFTPDMGQNLQSAKKIADLDPIRLLPGHGRPMVSDDLKERLLRFAESRMARWSQ